MIKSFALATTKLKSLKDNSHIIDFLVLSFVVILVAILYLHLGRDPLFDWDESIYAQLGVEILKSHHWLTPTWNGQIWLEKPPGIAWLTALSLSLFGHNEFAARFFMPLLAGSSLYLTYLIGRSLKDRTLGILAMLLLANMNLFLSRARVLNTDIALLFTILFTVYLVMSKRRPWLVALAIALSFFFKGFAGSLSFIIVLPLLIKKSKKYLLQVIGYWLLFILPWHLYQLIVNGSNFITPYFKEQVLRRATVPIEFHLESRWYYFHYLYQNLDITWIFLLVLGLLFLVFKLRSSVAHRWSLITLIWWFFFPLALFSLAKTRLYWYILPIYPAIALIIAYFLRQLASLHQLGYQILISFLGLYAIFTLQHFLTLVDPYHSRVNLPPKLELATWAHHFSNQGLLVLVPYHERVAEAILPSEQRISSSFRYGGAPSIVFYAQQPVTYFYDLDKFKSALVSNRLVLLTKQDFQQLQLHSLKILKSQGDYLLTQVK